MAQSRKRHTDSRHASAPSTSPKIPSFRLLLISIIVFAISLVATYHFSIPLFWLREPLVDETSAIVSTLPRHTRYPHQPNHITVASTSSQNHVVPYPPDFLTNPHHPRYRLLAALLSFAGYLQSATPVLESKLQHYNSLRSQNRRLFPEFPDKVNQALVASAVNADIATKITSHGMAVYNISQEELQKFANDYPGAENHPRTNWALRHLVRDWAASGSYERDTTFTAIMTSGVLKGRVLVPGACVGRLAADIAALKSVTEVVANEYSFHCIISGRWILDRLDKEKENFQIYPRIEEWSNHRSTTNSLLLSQAVPDVVAGSRGNLEWREGDFTTVFSGSQDVGTYQTVVTLFFIDTATDIVEYLTRIWKSLGSGGYWVNLGPVQYGGSDKLLELSLDEVLVVAERIGFVFEKVGGKAANERDAFEDEGEEWKRWAGKVKTWKAEYTTQKKSLRHNVYDVQYWVARKP